MKKQRTAAWYGVILVLIVALVSALSGCGGGSSATTDTNAGGTTYYTIGGTLSGLTGSGLVLQNVFTDDITINSGSLYFGFPKPLLSGAGYGVTIKTQPVGQTCTVTNGTGAVSGANVTNIAVTCVAK